jgi:hypothetical protein
MKEDVQKAWVEDLTSGNFTQGHGFLRVWDPDDEIWKYCCLGILCERSGLGTWVERTTDSGDLISEYLNSSMYLPPAVAEWAGLDPRTEESGEDTIQLRLAELNDEKTSFTEIAERLPEELAEFAEKEGTTS